MDLRTSSVKFCQLKHRFFKDLVYRQRCYLLHRNDGCSDFEVMPKRTAEKLVVSSQNRESFVRRNTEL